MQKIRSPREVEMSRAAAQLISIGTQAAYHVTRPGVTDAEIYAAFTFAQLARGGETGDGYQIGINQYGTHCGKPYGHVVRPGDLINLYISNVTYHGYTAQTARMIAVGEITARQEKVLAACTEGVKRAEKLIRPGASISDVNNAAFEPYIETGLLTSPQTRTMPYNWEAMPDGGPRLVPAAVCPRCGLGGAGPQADACLPGHERPAQSEPRPLGRHGGRAERFNVASHNYDRLEEGMVFVLHTQWLEAQSAGCNIGDLYLDHLRRFREPQSPHAAGDAPSGRLTA